MTPADRSRLLKIAGLLASDKVGERAAAAVKASAILKRAGMTWEEALSPAPGARTLVLVPTDTSALDAEIARLRASLATSEASRDGLRRQLQAERSVFWMGKDGGPWMS